MQNDDILAAARTVLANAGVVVAAPRRRRGKDRKPRKVYKLKQRPCMLGKRGKSYYYVTKSGRKAYPGKKTNRKCNPLISSRPI